MINFRGDIDSNFNRFSASHLSLDCNYFARSHVGERFLFNSLCTREKRPKAIVSTLFRTRDVKPFSHELWQSARPFPRSPLKIRYQNNRDTKLAFDKYEKHLDRLPVPANLSGGNVGRHNRKVLVIFEFDRLPFVGQGLTFDRFVSFRFEASWEIEGRSPRNLKWDRVAPNVSPSPSTLANRNLKSTESF